MDLLGALEELRQPARSRAVPARDRHGRRRPARAQGADRPARRLPAAPAARHRRAAAGRGRRLHRGGQVHAGQLAGRRPTSPSRACCGPPRWRPTLVVQPGRPRLVHGARTCCPACPASPAARRGRARCGWSPPRSLAAGAGAARRARHRLGGDRQPRAGRASCSPPPTCGCSSPPPPATPTRCRGASCARRASAARRSPSCSTGCRRRPSSPVTPRPRTPAGRQRSGRHPAVRRARGGAAVGEGPAARRAGGRRSPPG